MFVELKCGDGWCVKGSGGMMSLTLIVLYLDNSESPNTHGDNHVSQNTVSWVGNKLGTRINPSSRSLLTVGNLFKGGQNSRPTRV